MALPQSFIDKLKNKEVIPFVGAGLSRSVKLENGDSLFPSWPELLTGASKALEGERKPDDAALVRALVAKKELYQAAERAREGLGNAQWYRFLKTVFDRVSTDANQDSLLLNKLTWALGSNLVITTNYDRVLQWSCPDRSDFRVWDIEAKVEQVAAIRDGKVARPTVWHLHGQIDNAANIILTPDGYTKLYGERGKSRYAAAIDSLRSILKVRSFLFLGFSLQDQAFLKELLQIGEMFEGAASQHYILLPKMDAGRVELAQAGVEVIPYESHQQMNDLLTEMAIHAEQASPTTVQAMRYLVDKREGIHLFGGRGDRFFELYDEALKSLSGSLDIFSLKLSRFRRAHGKDLISLAQKIRVRIAILDPRFPLPKNTCSIASIREREEQSSSGAIMRDVAAWCDIYDDYRKQLAEGQIDVAAGAGLSIHLYNSLPTVNLFRADNSLFVGPYLLDVEDRDTPTFLIEGGNPRKAMGCQIFSAYERHFSAIWAASTTRPIKDVLEAERREWKKGIYDLDLVG